MDSSSASSASVLADNQAAGVPIGQLALRFEGQEEWL